jgi:hypothetical protein
MDWATDETVCGILGVNSIHTRDENGLIFLKKYVLHEKQRKIL